MTTPTGIESARAAAVRFMAEPVTILDQAVVRDASGGTRSVFTARAEPVRGWLSPPKDVEPSAVAGQVENRAALVLTLPWNTIIDEGARVRQVNGKLWTVAATLSIPSAASVSVRVLVREV